MDLSDPTTLVLSVILCLFAALFFYGRKRSGKYNLPPGPRPLPIIGNLHILDLKKPYQTLHQLSKKYGPVYTIKLGVEEVVVLCGYDAVKDALVNHADEFSGRPKVPMFHEITKGHGVIFAHNDNWKVMRRFTLSTLRDFGMGKETIENKITEESDFLVQKFRSYKGWSTLYNTFPSVMRWCSTIKNKVAERTAVMHEFIQETFTNQRKELDVNDQRNLIDSFLVKQQEEGKVQSEIEKVIGSAEPQVIHRKQMPYTDAVIHEIQRIGNIIPTNLPHATTQDVNFREYLLPKGTHVIPLLTSVLYDKEHFAKADEFYPEHFLDSSGNFLRKEAFMPFSAGKRSCAGESLAKMELFIFFTKLLQNFTFQAPPGATPDLTSSGGFTSGPLPHKICAIPRV
ncbi:hypothetical protein GDO78_018370 [Eleutherodactylus coqui]|uniref:Cytochrome P450 n=1 Tax=Eleutherodactylus coqui TaxID=57060 RepID=A0A8J6JR21_ELECQ|nr:hypothetical protein GDO78_018370 [Eleutherodactylus coqui]